MLETFTSQESKENLPEWFERLKNPEVFSRITGLLHDGVRRYFDLEADTRFRSLFGLIKHVEVELLSAILKDDVSRASANLLNIENISNRLFRYKGTEIQAFIELRDLLNDQFNDFFFAKFV